MKGSNILVSTEPKGRFTEGFITTSQTPKPGTVMQKVHATALQGGRWAWGVYDRSADGDRPLGAIAILLEDKLQGKIYSDAYAAGDRCFLYQPAMGEEFNMLLADVSGTADAHTIGELMMVDDGTGKIIATTGTPQTNPFVLLETVAAPTADSWAWMEFTGY